MAQVDKLIDALFKFQGSALIVAPDERVRLMLQGAERPISSQNVPAQQVLTLVKEILPAQFKEDFVLRRAIAFPYASPSGSVYVQGSWEGERLVVEISPEVEPAIAAALPTAPAPLAAVAAGVKDSTPVAAHGDREAMNALLREMVQKGCSDVHISVSNPPLFRKDGDLINLGNRGALSAADVQQLIFPITPPDREKEFESNLDSDFSYEIQNLARFRVNLFHDRTGPGAVLRMIPKDIPSAKQLGLPKCVLDFCTLPKGFVVVTGPTGSGKSTTLAAMIDHINDTRPAHIISIEDPIEFVHKTKRSLINQREIGSHTKGFKQALRAALREDPDIVLVGEMRDLETISIALETAETGHLVFGTLHTNTAPSAVDRIIDQFPSEEQNQVRTMLSGTLRGVVAQTLCKRKGGGRVAAQEILVVNPAVSNLIREGKTFQIPSIMQTGRGLGMIMLNDSLLDLVKKGIVEPDEALAKSANRGELETMLTRSGVTAGA